LNGSPRRAANDAAAEATLVALAIAGDDQAFEQLVRRRQGFVRALLHRLCRDPALSDDLAQQVFLQAWRSLRALRSAGAFGAWLRRLAVNTWLQHLRAQHADTAAITDGELASQSAPGLTIDLDNALGTLPAPVRLCVVLNYHEGMSHGAISDMSGLPLGTVKSHIARGAAQLRRILVDYGDGHDG
jgi:RNA polymerase sigma factor (sigma-70 family)